MPFAKNAKVTPTYFGSLTGALGDPTSESTMRPGQISPNELEVAILEQLSRKEPSLAGSFTSLHVLSREFTGVGSFTTFKCVEPSTGVEDRHISLDVCINMPDVSNGLGAVLFLKDGKPECLEIFTYGDEHWEGRHDGFTIGHHVSLQD